MTRFEVEVTTTYSFDVDPEEEYDTYHNITHGMDLGDYLHDADITDSYVTYVEAGERVWDAQQEALKQYGLL